MTKVNYDIELAKIDDRIIQLKKEIEMGEALNRLHENADFINVIVDGYFTDEEERITGLLFNPTTLKREQIENVMDKATAIRNYKLYFQTTLINASMAPEQIDDEESYRKKLTAQGYDVGGEDE